MNLDEFLVENTCPLCALAPEDRAQVDAALVRSTVKNQLGKKVARWLREHRGVEVPTGVMTHHKGTHIEQS